MTESDRAQRAERAWDAMRAAHRKRARLRVRQEELELARDKAALEVAKIALELEECDARSDRAFHLAQSLSDNLDPAAREVHAEQARAPYIPNRSHVEWCEEQVARSEKQLGLAREHLAKVRAEQRADREWHKQMIRYLRGRGAA